MHENMHSRCAKELKSIPALKNMQSSLLCGIWETFFHATILRQSYRTKVFGARCYMQQYMVAFWKRLWALSCMRRAISFKWLMIHYVLPVGSHLEGQVDDHRCVCCQVTGGNFKTFILDL